MVSALRVVDEVVSYTDVDVTIKTLDFEFFAVGRGSKSCRISKSY